MSKTPVSILQEMMVKKQMVPDYDLIHNGGGTHDNTFIYRVSCDGLSATGTGRSKKEAKHEAAKAMLEAIAAERAYPQLPAAPTQSPVKTCLPTSVPLCQKSPANTPFFNAIGDLKALCCDINVEEPTYEQISDIGPPHERIFTMKCVVATFTEKAAATTKKQAKHEAARKMLDRLRSLLNNSDVGEDLRLQIQSKDTAEAQAAQDEYTKTMYPVVSKVLPMKKANLGLKVSEYYHNLATLYEEGQRKELVENLRCLIPVNNSTDVIPKIEEYLKPLELTLSRHILPTISGDVFVVALKIGAESNITVCAIGNTEEEATCNAISKLIERMIFLLGC